MAYISVSHYGVSIAVPAKYMRLLDLYCMTSERGDRIAHRDDRSLWLQLPGVFVEKA